LADTDRYRWQALTLVCVAFFMTVLDVSIVTVALPSITRSLHFSATSLQWILTAYAITFGGFLLLGGRIGDLLGRRLMFMSGLALFAAASLTCGLASGPAMLITARAIQGLGAAIISPATLAIITTTFKEGAERNKALGIWGAMGGAGAAAGVLFGGLLTRYAGWEWIFFVNVPVGAFVLLATPFRVSESRAPLENRRFDMIGAVTVTGGVALLVYAISRAPAVGWSSAQTVGILIGSLVVLAFFLAWERREMAPLMPLSVFRIRSVSAANAVALLLGATVFGNFFLLTLYVQDVLHFSALRTGLTFLATAGTTVVVAGIAQAATTRFGARPVLTAGMTLLVGGMVWYAQIPVHGRFVADLLGGYVLVGVGLALSFVSVSIAALSGVGPKVAGLASGLINTTQQVGGAIGVAVTGSVAVSRADGLLASGHSSAYAFTHGYALGFWVMAGIALAGLLLALVTVPRARPSTADEIVPTISTHFSDLLPGEAPAS
jgi:EmrB/QacA subfamily drug resistance transporter